MATTSRILIIDDNVNLARGFAIALGRAGYEVAVAHTADDGLRLAAEFEPLELEDADEPVLALVVGPQSAARHPED